MTVRFDNVTVRYAKSGAPALKDVTLSFGHGELVGILGRSGAGKSTLIRCVNGLVEPTAGSVNVDERDVSTLRGRRRRELRSRIGMVFQQFGLVPRTSALTNVLLGRIGQRPTWRNAVGFFDRREREQAHEALRAVELEAYANRRVEQLSGGQQQRVAIARALMQQPTVLLGDEPVSSLDPVTARGIMELFAHLHAEERRLTILNLHDLELALRYCPRIVGLRDGRVVYDGPAEDVNEQVRRLIYGG
ncbi:phosphonate ABC transporter ATP-binding protein [Paenibacillus sp. TRM 82003]|nr:phosphonate ABC transporter ATP-binding protein [Paenibacillus sp. TRM 82003]